MDIGNACISRIPSDNQLTILDIELDAQYYTKEFSAHDHFNYLGHEKNNNSAITKPAAVSVLVKKKGPSAQNVKKTMFELVVLCRTPEKDERKTFTITSKSDNISSKKALKLTKENIPKMSTFSLEEVADKNLVDNLKEFEVKQLKNQYRIGVIYCKDGQTSEDEMYSNVNPCLYFTEFLEVLGTPVELKGWTKFKGGLDVRGNTTGTHSIYTPFQGYEVMFHISTMLPFQASDLQRVERKRHIGNDVVVIVFVDIDENASQPNMKFDPSIIKSQFNHVWVVVHVDHTRPPQSEDKTTHYKIALIFKDGVPLFEPDFPRGYSFPKDKMRNFFLTKLINAERAALHAPTFAQKLKRTRKEALTMMHDGYLGSQ